MLEAMLGPSPAETLRNGRDVTSKGATLKVLSVEASVSVPIVPVYESPRKIMPLRSRRMKRNPIGLSILRLRRDRALKT